MGWSAGRFTLALLLLPLLHWAPVRAQSPQEHQARFSEAIQLISSGRFSRAEQILRELEEAIPGDGEIKHRLGLVLLRQKKVQAASLRLEAAARLQPASPLAWLAVARTRILLGKRSEAVAAAEQANRLAPEEPLVWRALAMLYDQAGEPAKAARFEERWSNSRPQDTEAAIRVVARYLRAGDAGSAIAAGQRALERSDAAELHYLLGKAYQEKNDPAKAAERLQRAIRIDAGKPEYYGGLAALFLQHRTPQPAVLILEQAVQRLPKEIELLRLLGLAHYATGNTQKALSAFLRITEIDPDSEAGYSSLETLLPEAGARLDEIVSRLRSFCDRRPGELGYYLLALALTNRAGDSAEPAELLKKAVARNPEFWPAHFELHKHLSAAGMFEEARQALEKPVELNPGYAPAHYELAKTYSRSGQRERAVEERKIHHQLVTQRRDEAERRRQEIPACLTALSRPDEPAAVPKSERPCPTRSFAATVSILRKEHDG